MQHSAGWLCSGTLGAALPRHNIIVLLLVLMHQRLRVVLPSATCLSVMQQGIAHGVALLCMRVGYAAASMQLACGDPRLLWLKSGGQPRCMLLDALAMHVPGRT